MIEQIEWIACADRLPDDDTTVLICTTGTSEPVWLGYVSEENECWLDTDGMPVSVTHWSPMPAGPRG